MIDPTRITKYDRTQAELEEFALFSVLVAGKTAKVVARGLDSILTYLDIGYHTGSPMLDLTNHANAHGIEVIKEMLSISGIGCYERKSATCLELANRTIYKKDFLQTCTVSELEGIYGIGAKTARFFILHSRPGQRVAALDTHILHYLRDCGIAAPKSTPAKGSKKYVYLESKFLDLCDSAGKDYAQMDLEIWTRYSSKGRAAP